MSNQVDIDNRVKNAAIDGIVHVTVPVIVQPSGLDRQEPLVVANDSFRSVVGKQGKRCMNLLYNC